MIKKQVDEIDVQLPHPALPGADWADGYSVIIDQPFETARAAGDAIVAAFPKWTNPAMFVRQVLVTPFGLKGAPSKPEKNQVGIFPVKHETTHALYAGMDDSHLDFRISIEIGNHAHGQAVRLITVIKRHNALGRIYLQIVLPFHRKIIKSALAKLS